MHLTADPQSLQTYLQARGWLQPAESVTGVEKPGEGNMNYTLRVRTPERTLIVKQSRAYVEKYPDIPAPASRAVLEGRFYREIAGNPVLQSFMPGLLGVDEAHNVLVLEDLGDARDFTGLYRSGEALTAEELEALLTYLSELHAAFLTDRPDPAFANPDMRRLNHEHIFRYPFMEENGFDLDTIQPGLQAVAMDYKRDEKLKQAVAALGERYFPGDPDRPSTLLHGDYYPGSWLRTAAGVRIIDPEFAFYGPAEFDLGVMIAHLSLSRQPDSVVDAALAGYRRPEGFDEDRMWQFSAVEVMRRLIGLAQLPVSLTLEEKETLLIDAYNVLI